MKEYDYDVTFDGLLNGKIKRKKRRRPILYAVIIIALFLTLALLLGGCSGWGAKRTEYPDGRVVITARQWQCLTDSKRTQMKFAIPDLGIAEVGTSILDAESIAAIGKVIAEIMQPWWLIGGKAVKP